MAYFIYFTNFFLSAFGHNFNVSIEVYAYILELKKRHTHPYIHITHTHCNMGYRLIKHLFRINILCDLGAFQFIVWSFCVHIHTTYTIYDIWYAILKSMVWLICAGLLSVLPKHFCWNSEWKFSSNASVIFY